MNQLLPVGVGVRAQFVNHDLLCGLEWNKTMINSPLIISPL